MMKLEIWPCFKTTMTMWSGYGDYSIPSFVPAIRGRSSPLQSFLQSILGQTEDQSDTVVLMMITGFGHADITHITVYKSTMVKGQLPVSDDNMTKNWTSSGEYAEKPVMKLIIHLNHK